MIVRATSYIEVGDARILRGTSGRIEEGQDVVKDNNIVVIWEYAIYGHTVVEDFTLAVSPVLLDAAPAND